MSKLQGRPLFGSFSYRGGAVKRYCCSVCRIAGVKLWREYHTMACNTKLYCGDCVVRNQKKPGRVQADGRYYPTKAEEFSYPTYAVGCRIPAVPTEDGHTLWDYTWVPEDGVRWWHRLPTRPRSRGLRCKGKYICGGAR